jgi:CubicO group peptidase (beta-lactamase class C family)
MRSTVRLLGGLILALLITLPAVTLAADTGSARDLVGLWQARQRFGPDVRGELLLIHGQDGWRATVAGRSARVDFGGKEVSFDLGSGKGSFRGHFEGPGLIRGHWTQPRTVTSGSRYATPVVLRPDGADLWRGQVAPLDEAFTLYLKVGEGPDGTTSVFLRNPERNIGVYANLVRLTRDGGKVSLIGRPRGSDKDVEIAEGAYDADNEMLSVNIRGGTYDFTRAGEDSDFYPRGARPAPYAYHPPVDKHDGWTVGSVDQVGVSRAGIARFVDFLTSTPIDGLHAPEIHGVLIARHGKLVVEEYFHGEYGDKLHDTRSAAKSLASVLIGAAIQDGVKLSPSTQVYRAMGVDAAGLDPRKRAMTLENLLNMASGFYCDDGDAKAPGNENVMQDQTGQPDWYRYALDLPIASAPGGPSIYCSTNPNLAGGVLAKVSGQRLEDMFDRLIAEPMQFGRYALTLQPTGEPYMGGGSQFLPRDFMKLGQLMLDGGTWHGRRIVGRDWVARSSATPRDLSGIHYGYLWWGVDLPHEGGTLKAYFAAGNGGQVVMVVPALDLVVAVYGGNYSDKVMYDTQRVYVPTYVIPAVEAEGSK